MNSDFEDIFKGNLILIGIYMYSGATHSSDGHKALHMDGCESLSYDQVRRPLILGMKGCDALSHERVLGTFIWTGPRPFHKASCEALSYCQV